MNLRFYITIVGLFISLNLYSQIKVASDSIYEYKFGANQNLWDKDCFSEDSVCVEVKEIVYPIIESNNFALNAFINDTIQKLLELNQIKEKSPKLEWEYNCADNKPFEFYANYKLIFSNQDFLCLTIHTSEYACCGANGSRHESIPFTFDLKQKKILQLKDIVEEEFYKIINEIVYREINDSTLENFDTIDYLNYFIEISSENVRIYYETPESRGRNISFDFEIEYNNHIFTESFLSSITK